MGWGAMNGPDTRPESTQSADTVVDLAPYPDIVRAAVKAILDFESWQVDPIGYDLAYYQEDLPRVVAEAIKPWRQYDG